MEGRRLVVWAKFDDRYSESQKVLEAGPWAELLDMRAIIYCCRNETDGLVTLSALTRIGSGIPAVKKKAAILVDVGRWTVNAGGGWLVHDFLAYNPSHAQLENQRSEGKERAKRSRERNPKQGGTFAVGSGDLRGRAQDGTGISEEKKAPPPWLETGENPMDLAQRSLRAVSEKETG